MEKRTKLTRRQFVHGAAGGAAASIVGQGLLTARPVSAARRSQSNGIPEEWDYEAEVVVVGFGGAGACAAIAAHDEGSKVLILEKQAADEGDKINHTPNTRQSGGAFPSPSNVEDAIAYMGVASRVNVDMPESKDIDDDIIEAWAKYAVQNKDWLTGLGATGFVDFYTPNVGRDASWPGNDAIQSFMIQKEDGAGGVGFDFFNFLADKVSERDIEVLWETPAVRLITNEEGEVIGVRASQNDTDVFVKATKAVILTCGGFEYDEAAKKTYFPAFPMAVDGNPANTGDGLRMALDLGADLWHMTVIGGAFKMKVPDFPVPFRPSLSLNLGAAIALDKSGRRFKAENQLGGYSGYWNAIVYDTVKYTWPRIPVYWVFDEARRQAAPMVGTASAAAGPIGLYKWSKDNSEEVEKGWIIQADTVEDLAEQLEVDPKGLQEEIDKYNAFCEAGKDDDFGRPEDTLMPLEPPFYAIALYPGPNNTFGGPRRNAKAQIVNAFGEPIPRLYSAGELGSIFVQYPQGGANVAECIAFGRIAGEQAAAEKPWE